MEKTSTRSSDNAKRSMAKPAPARDRHGPKRNEPHREPAKALVRLSFGAPIGVSQYSCKGSVPFASEMVGDGCGGGAATQVLTCGDTVRTPAETVMGFRLAAPLDVR